MGSSPSSTSTAHVCDLIRVGESDRYYGRGIFAVTNIPENTILQCECSGPTRRIDFPGLANDANFIFPQEWNHEHLRLVLEHYQKDYQASTSNVGMEMVSGGKDLYPQYKTLREIKAGEELTYRYGLGEWGRLIDKDLQEYDFEDPSKTPGLYFVNKSERDHAAENWEVILEEFGGSITKNAK